MQAASSDHNPYRPPEAALGDGNIGYGESHDPALLRYAGFWLRLGAFFVDGLLSAPLVIALLAAIYLLPGLSPWMALPGPVFGLFYYLYLVHRFGGTPGQRAFGLRTTLVDGSRITWAATLRRYSVALVIGLVSTAAFIISTLAIDNDAYAAAAIMERPLMLAGATPHWATGVHWASSIWAFSEFITMFFNPKRRAFQDLIGATVVIKSR